MYKRIMIAGTGSGCGKTTVTCSLLAALASLGKNVISFKCGPDYIDPMFHKKATGVESRNLDVFLMGEHGVKFGVHHHAANREVSVLEGVMGIYDGLGSGSFASSNSISILTNTPVILVVNAKGAALSVCALIYGFLAFEKNHIRGVILNGISEGMFGFYRQMIEERVNIRVIGFMPYIPEAQIEHRHLGLVTADELIDIQEKIKILSQYARNCIDINALLDVAAQAEPFEYIKKFLPPVKEAVIKIYVAYDNAFSFWYEENHDLLRGMGAEIRLFSPIYDKELPNDADGLVLWGGYPELYGLQLENNISMKHSIKLALEAGLPVYAECGGFVYLQQSLTDLQGKTYEMLGVIPGDVKMASKLQNFGYYELVAQIDNLLCKIGDRINAHFFHYYTNDYEGSCFKAVKQNGKTFPCIVSERNIFAGYQHLHFWGNFNFAKNFVNACIEYKKRRSAE